MPGHLTLSNGIRLAVNRRMGSTGMGGALRALVRAQTHRSEWLVEELRLSSGLNTVEHNSHVRTWLEPNTTPRLRVNWELAQSVQPFTMIRLHATSNESMDTGS
jgi:hypothetical protein